MGDTGISRVDGVSHVFKSQKDKGIRIIVPKVIDEFLVVGNIKDIKEFLRGLGRELEVGKTEVRG